ncbi:MAG: dihydropteroate synthase [Lysobacterales bacterium]
MKNTRSLTKKRSRYTIKAGNHQLRLGDKTHIMGVLNLTNDSFSQDGCLNKANSVDHAIRKAKNFIRNGASIIDVGGESSRPGATQISVKEEVRRIIPTISAVSKFQQSIVSVDTYKSTVAKHALDAGAIIVNNIMGSTPNVSLLKMVRNYNAAIVLMHIKGIPRTMQTNIKYKSVVSDIIDTLQKSINVCLDSGISKDRIIIDPGIGFGKTVGHNLTLLNQLTKFNELKTPILIGTSRKSFIGKVLNKEPQKSLLGTMATVTSSILKGAHIVRVHDVKETKEVVDMTDAIINETEKGTNT